MSIIRGTILMTPTSVSTTAGTASISNGRVSFSAAQNLVVNGVFTSAYDVYVVYMSHWVSTGELTFPYFTVSGSAPSGSYDSQDNRVAGTSNNTTSRYTTSATTLYSDANQLGAAIMYFVNPAKSAHKAFRFLTGNGDGDQTSQYISGTTSFTTACDGFGIANSIGLNGHLTVHAFNQ